MSIRERVLNAIANYCNCAWHDDGVADPPERCECDDRADDALAELATWLDERAKAHDGAWRPEERSECRAIAAELRGKGT